MYQIINKKTGKVVEDVVLAQDGRLLIAKKDAPVMEVEDPETYEIREYRIPDRKNFISILDKMELVDQKMNILNNALDESCINSQIFFPTVNDEILNYFCNVFHDDTEAIWDYVCDMEYGKNERNRFLTDSAGRKHMVKNSGDLYDFLVNQMNRAE